MKKKQSTTVALIVIGMLFAVILPLLFMKRTATGSQLPINIMRGAGFVLLIVAVVRGYREKNASN
jgi:hypothetical protein